MSDFTRAITLIKKYEGFSEKAYPDPFTGSTPYTLGYGTQFYPDGSPVKQGHRCTKQKALEYLNHEVEIIHEELLRLNLGLDDCMMNALISFVHSVGWDSFLYSEIIDAIEVENWSLAADEITQWIFDAYYKVIGGLLDRRQEEAALFLTDLKAEGNGKSNVLLRAFSSYTGAPYEIKAITFLESHLNPYILAEFANQFDFENSLDQCLEYEEPESIFISWD